MSVEGPRILVEQMDGLEVTVDPEGTVLTHSGDSWHDISIPPQQYTFVNREYYDLNGLQMQDLTFFFTNVMTQEEYTPYGTLGFFLIDLVSTSPISRADIQEASIPDITQTRDLPGFLDSNFRSQEIIMGQQRYFHGSVDLSLQITLAGITSWGTATSSAADRVHITRIVYILTNPPGGPPLPGLATFQIPPVNIVTAGVIAKESEGSYQMRLHKSLTLAGQQ